MDALMESLWESAITHVHTHAIRKAHENIDNTLKVAEKILTQFDVSRKVESKIIEGPREDLGGYLAAVDELRTNVEFFTYNSSFKSSDSALNHAHGLLSKAMTRLEEEFKSLLTLHSKMQEPARLMECLPNSVRSTPTSGSQGGGGEESAGKGVPSHPANGKNAKGLEGFGSLIPPKVIPQLHELAQRMITAGHHQQCCKIYRDVRAVILEQTLRKLGVEKLSREDVYKMQWDVLEGKITNWIHFMRIAVKLLFSGERKLCDQVFHELEPHRETCFAEVTSNSVTMLLSFGEGIAKSKRSPEKLFVLLDMYETMRELFPEVEAIFGGKPSAPIREAVSGLTQRLAQTAEETFSDFSEAVEKDVTKTPVQDGTVHPLTSYVINYVKFLFDYQVTLRQLFGEDEAVEPANSQLAAATMKIMSALQTNLDGKSKLYRDPALAHVFLMNNIHYMVKSVRRSEAKDVLGEDWVQRHRRIVQQHAQNYKRVAWTKVLQSLSVQGLTSSGSGGLGNDGSISTGVSRALLKERFKTFNIQFDELYQRQTQWFVPDAELRESLRLAVAEVLLPAYRSFLKHFGSLMESGKNPQKYVRFSPEKLDAMLGELFEGKTRTEPRR
ncbi:hypothetical protein GOP47_0011138 [Adiantum capillus-veneris]|uniref:Exocyst subunit Exo70 family protein n=1 Tax=Adiantum capillus-veneris TaxID=13818 RepID=A0A9D4US78_ADICA|nr:hypothetical protein GOP47_0011138 [Adiantum capillus-veneris]